MTNTVKLLQELIAIPSVNPAFRPEGDQYAGEQGVGDYLASTASSAGLDVEFQAVAPGRSNVLIRHTPARFNRRVLLAPHMDTVGGEDMASLVRPRLEGGRLYGRGACDTKGSVAAMLAALMEVSRDGGPSETEIILAALVDEECAQQGSRTLAKTCRADLAIVGEPTRLAVVTAHKGVLWLSLETRGKAAHGARPELGRNAVHEMARVVDLLETTYAAKLKKRKHPTLGHATINVGSMHGGSQHNIVPAECIALVDRRLLPGETDFGVQAEMRAFFRKHKLKVLMEPSHAFRCPALDTDPQNELVRQFLRTAKQKRFCGVDFFSDAGVLAEHGIPSVLFGPGDIAQAHTPGEYVEAAQLERATKMLVSFLKAVK